MPDHLMNRLRAFIRLLVRGPWSDDSYSIARRQRLLSKMRRMGER